MRGPLIFAATLLCAGPAWADDDPAQEAKLAVNGFMNAIASDDKTDLADHMVPEAMIFVHNRMDPANPRVDHLTVAQHLENWAKRDARYIEDMAYTSVLVDGDMAHVWGPYSFWVNYELSHCGINSLNLVRTQDGWKVANTSFTMERPSECERLGVPGFPAEEIRDDQ